MCDRFSRPDEKTAVRLQKLTDELATPRQGLQEKCILSDIGTVFVVGISEAGRTMTAPWDVAQKITVRVFWRKSDTASSAAWNVPVRN